MYLKLAMWKLIANIQGNSEREASSPLKILSELEMPHFLLLIKLKFLWALTTSKSLSEGKFVILESITGAVVCTLGATVETIIAADIPADAPSGQQTSCWFFYDYSEYFRVRNVNLTANLRFHRSYVLKCYLYQLARDFPMIPVRLPKTSHNDEFSRK